MLQPRDVPLLSIFAAVVRNGSITGAARELRLAKSVVSENLKSLEEKCRVRLVDRSTRHLRVTEAGAVVLASARTVEEAMRELSAQLDSETDTATGTLRVASTHDLAALVVAPVAAELVSRHPGLRIDIEADDREHDLIASKFDVAVRLGSPRDSAYIMKQLARFEEPIVAAPVLAEAYRHATRPRDLAGAPWIRHALLSDEVMTFLGPGAEREQVTVVIRGQANSAFGVRALLLGGAGLGCLPEYILADELDRGALIRLCPDWVWKRVSLYALLPSQRHTRKSVTVFLDALKARLAVCGKRTMTGGKRRAVVEGSRKIDR